VEKEKITAATVRADFNDLIAVVHYTRAAHELGLWASERKLIRRFFPDHAAPLLEAGCGAGRVTLGLWALGYRHLTAFDFAEELVDQARSLAAERGADTGPCPLRFLHADATQLPPDLSPILSDPPEKTPQDSGSVSHRLNDVVAGPRSPGPGIDHSANLPPSPAPPGPATRGAAPCRPSRSGAGRPTAAAKARAAARAPAVKSPPPGEPAHRSAPDARFAGALFMFNGLMQIPGRAHRRTALRELHRVCAPGAPLLFTTHDRDATPTERAQWRLETLRWTRGDQDPRLLEFGDRYFEEAGVGRTFMHLPDRAEILADLAATGWVHEFDAMRSAVARETRAVLDFSDACRFWVARRA
jgi:SAM-dependent methyltransferase